MTINPSGSAMRRYAVTVAQHFDIKVAEGVEPITRCVRD
jgi:hypothetical protein